MAIEREVDDSGRENAIVIRDRRKPNQYTTDNLIAREWLPILRVGDAFFFYSVYLSMANRRTESSWGSLRTMAQYLQCGIDLIIRGNRLLEICELIYIEPGNQHTTNEYYILDPPSLDEELITRVRRRLDEIEKQEKSKNWTSWIKQIRKALDRHQSLPDIWATRRANRGGRPVRTKETYENQDVADASKSTAPVQAKVRQEAIEHGISAAVAPSGKGACESQAGFSSRGVCESQAPYTWFTSSELVSHKQGVCDSQAEQEQPKEKTNKTGKKESLGSPDPFLLRQKYLALGITLPVFEVLVERYPLERLQHQLDWLPARAPRDPPAMLVRAVQENWTAPAQFDDSGAERSQKTRRQSAKDTGTDAGESYVFERAEKQNTNEITMLNVEEKSIEVQKVWARVLRELEMQMTRATFDMWLRGSQAVDMRGNGIVVQVRDSYTAEWLQSRLLVPIQRTLEGIAGQTLDVVFELGRSA